MKRGRTSELEIPDVAGEDTFVYFSYKLARPVICTINFRGFITQGDPLAKVVPVKCGEGHKFTQEGVIRVPRVFDPSKSTVFNKVKVKYRTVTPVDYEEANQKARIKVYFRGFPLQTPVEEITRFFSVFGRIEYLYLMGPTKSKSAHRSAQGYIIYSSNDSAHKVLNQDNSLLFRGIKIFCEIYQTKKKKKTSSNPLASRFNPMPEPIDCSATHPGSATGSSFKDKYLKLQNTTSNQNSGQIQQGSAINPNNRHEVQLGSLQPLNESSRPYLKHAYLVKSNSADQDNLRFNICLKKASRVTDQATH